MFIFNPEYFENYKKICNDKEKRIFFYSNLLFTQKKCLYNHQYRIFTELDFSENKVKTIAVKIQD